MKKDELESLLKSFLLFFISIELLISVIAYFYYKQQVSYEEQAIFLEMKNFNYTLRGEKFSVDLVSRSSEMQTLVLEKNSDNIYVFFPIPQVEDTLLKVIYPRKDYDLLIKSLEKRFIVPFFIITFFVGLLSVSFAFYTLRPLRRSLKLLQEFLKDIIHDLNTPVSAILLNSKMLRKNVKPERIDRIELSAKTIAGLHRNLESFLRKAPQTYTKVDLKSLLEERIDYFRSIYPALDFVFYGMEVSIDSSEDALRRIIDNIIGNACKYNRPGGSVTVTLTEGSVTIDDSGYGIKDKKRIFDRYYKEGERGLGIGLHIVKTLSAELGMTVSVESSEKGSSFTLCWN